MNIQCGFCASPDAKPLQEGSSIGICEQCTLKAVLAWGKAPDELPFLDLDDFAAAATKYEPLLQNRSPDPRALEELGCFISSQGTFEPGHGPPTHHDRHFVPILRRIK